MSWPPVDVYLKNVSVVRYGSNLRSLPGLCRDCISPIIGAYCSSDDVIQIHLEMYLGRKKSELILNTHFNKEGFSSQGSNCPGMRWCIHNQQKCGTCKLGLWVESVSR